jgi:hypothetical protein
MKAMEGESVNMSYTSKKKASYKEINKAAHGIKKGALHRELGLPEHIKIPVHTLEEIRIRPIGDHVFIHYTGKHVPITHKLKERANFALVLEKHEMNRGMFG